MRQRGDLRKDARSSLSFPMDVVFHKPFTETREFSVFAAGKDDPGAS
jgi:hypothetical protein